GVDPEHEQSWAGYATALMVFNLLGIALLFAVLALQGVLPLNPQHFGGVETLLAFNTAVSFVTNTNWQNYGGETTLSHLSQMAGLTVQNFLSAAT
ncbi:potassium-transporting ATPase subunit KdpA, partial [Pseudomonas aeruginosa]|uniref:potassium-transporting ATPase subunit KdpA n=1 Tax=Pseudomonas aeruginosa TaxID=287 RepID=UPI002F950215